MGSEVSPRCGASSSLVTAVSRGSKTQSTSPQSCHVSTASQASFMLALLLGLLFACTGDINGMPPKPKPRDHFVDGVPCRIYPSGVIVVAIGDHKNEFPVRVPAKSTTDVAACERKVREHPRFSLLSKAANDSSARSRGPTEEIAVLCELCSPACTVCLMFDESSYEDLLVLPGGRFVCDGCVLARGNMSLELQAESLMAAREAVARQPSQLEPRKSTRSVKPVNPVYLPGWSDYDNKRRGERHGQSREETYSEVQSGRDRLLADITEARR